MTRQFVHKTAPILNLTIKSSNIPKIELEVPIVYITSTTRQI